MSLVATYVQSAEGDWFENPIVRDPDWNWFICWDDDEPIELVIKDSAAITAKMVLDELKAKGWELIATHRSHSAGCSRIFNHGFEPANAVYLRQQSNGPPRALISTGIHLPFEPTGQGVYYFNTRNGHKR